MALQKLNKLDKKAVINKYEIRTFGEVQQAESMRYFNLPVSSRRIKHEWLVEIILNLAK